MTADRRHSIRRWAQLALAAAVVMYGIAGFPTPDDPDQSQAAAIDLGCFLLCDGPITVVVEHDDGTTTTYHVSEEGTEVEHSEGGDPSEYRPSSTTTITSNTQTTTITSNNDGTTTTTTTTTSTVTDTELPTSGCSGWDAAGCRQGIEQGYIRPGENMGATPSTDRLGAMADQFAQENKHLGFDADAFNDAIDNAENPAEPNRGEMADALCAAISGCSGTGEAAINYLLNEGISFGQDAPTFDGYNAGNRVTVGQTSMFFHRIQEALASPGYTPPGGHSYTPPPGGGTPGSTCQTGFQVIAAHVDGANGDDGCRPVTCDFGRGGDGWCLPPASDDPPLVYVLGPTRMHEGGGTAWFRVTLSHATTQPVSVTVATTDGTATAGSDYVAVTDRTITLPVSHTVRSVSVPIIDDRNLEPDETFTLGISDPSTNAALSTSAEIETTIADNEPLPPQNVALVCSTGSAPFTLTATWEGTPTGTLTGADERVWLVRANADGSTSGLQGDLFPSGHTSTFTVSQAGRYRATVEWSLSSDPLSRVRATATAECGDVLDLLTVTCTSTSSGDISLRLGWDASLGSEDVYVFVRNYDLYSDVFHTYDDLAEGSAMTGFNWGTTSNPTGGRLVTFTEMRTPGNIFGDAFSDEPTNYEFSLPNQPDVAAVSITIPGSSGDLASVCPSPAVSLSDTALTVTEGASVRVGAVLDSAPTAAASVRFTLAGALNGGGSCATGADFYVSANEFAFNSGDTAASVTLTACDDTDADDETVALELVATGISGLQLGSPTAMRVTIADDDCAAGEHHHEADPDATGPYCHSDDHFGPPLCDANLAQTWRLHSGGGHIDRVTAPCPLPTVTANLAGPAGLRLSLEISVAADAANPREFRVYATNGGCSPSAADCAVPGVHYHDAIKSDEDCSTDAGPLTFTSSAAQTVYLCTLIDVNHGISDRLLDVVVQDTHVLRGSVYVIEAARIEPPMRGTQ